MPPPSSLPANTASQMRRRAFQQCYNAQVAVEGEHQLVVATEVTANASDQGGLPLLSGDSEN